MLNIGKSLGCQVFRNKREFLSRILKSKCAQQVTRQWHKTKTKEGTFLPGLPSSEMVFLDHTNSPLLNDRTIHTNYETEV